jgi:hypothetical protein
MENDWYKYTSIKLNLNTTYFPNLFYFFIKCLQNNCQMKLSHIRDNVKDKSIYMYMFFCYSQNTDWRIVLCWLRPIHRFCSIIYIHSGTMFCESFNAVLSDELSNLLHEHSNGHSQPRGVRPFNHLLTSRGLDLRGKESIPLNICQRFYWSLSNEDFH